MIDQRRDTPAFSETRGGLHLKAVGKCVFTPTMNASERSSSRSMCVRHAVLLGVASLLAMAMIGCCSDGSDPLKADGQQSQKRVVLDEAETRRVVDAFNARVRPLERFKARANVRLRFRDLSRADEAEAPLREEQPEGLLQVIRPDRLALSLGKAGKTLFWFGCDDQEFWWFDLEKEPSATVGARAALTPEQRDQLGLAVAPWEFVAMLGITPLPIAKDNLSAQAAPGQAAPLQAARVEVARVGEQGELELTVFGVGDAKVGSLPRTSLPRSSVPRSRYFLASADAMPTRVELFGAAGELIAWSELSGVQTVELKDKPAGVRAEIPATAFIHSALDETEARVTLTGATDAKIADQSFQLAALLKHFKVPPERVSRIDVEALEGGPAKPEPAKPEPAKPEPAKA